MKVLVTGGTGQLGSALMDNLSGDIYGTTTQKDKVRENMLYLDLADKSSFASFEDLDFDVVILNAALGHLERCESEKEYSDRVNVEGQKKLVDMFKGSKIIFISSYYVFDGTKENYLEEDDTNPLNHYGHQKVEIENYIISNCEDYLIIRPTKIMDIGYGSKNLLGRANEYLANGEEFTTTGDLFTNPISATYCAKIIKELLSKDARGVINVGGKTKATNYELIKMFADHFKIDAKIKVVETDQTGVKRPYKGTLSLEKLTELGINAPTLKECFVEMETRFEDDRARRN